MKRVACAECVNGPDRGRRGQALAVMLQPKETFGAERYANQPCREGLHPAHAFSGIGRAAGNPGKDGVIGARTRPLQSEFSARLFLREWPIAHLAVPRET